MAPRVWFRGSLLDGARATMTFEHLVGPTSIAVDGYFSVNAQSADLPLLPARYRAVVRSSEWLRRLAERFPPLVGVADSLYVSATVNAASRPLVAEPVRRRRYAAQ